MGTFICTFINFCKTRINFLTEFYRFFNLTDYGRNNFSNSSWPLACFCSKSFNFMCDYRKTLSCYTWMGSFNRSVHREKVSLLCKIIKSCDNSENFVTGLLYFKHNFLKFFHVRASGSCQTWKAWSKVCSSFYTFTNGLHPVNYGLSSLRGFIYHLNFLVKLFTHIYKEVCKIINGFCSFFTNLGLNFDGLVNFINFALRIFCSCCNWCNRIVQVRSYADRIISHIFSLCENRFKPFFLFPAGFCKNFYLSVCNIWTLENYNKQRKFNQEESNSL